MADVQTVEVTVQSFGQSHPFNVSKEDANTLIKLHSMGCSDTTQRRMHKFKTYNRFANIAKPMVVSVDLNKVELVAMEDDNG